MTKKEKLDPSPKLTIGFTEELIQPILDGKKMATYRLGTKYAHLNNGDIIALENTANKNIFAYARVKKIEVTTMNDLPLEKEGHSTYSSKANQLQRFGQIYNRAVQLSDDVVILEFELL
jgi:hypothetical protein